MTAILLITAGAVAQQTHNQYEPPSAAGAGQKLLAQFAGEWDVVKTFFPINGQPMVTRERASGTWSRRASFFSLISCSSLLGGPRARALEYPASIRKRIASQRYGMTRADYHVGSSERWHIRRQKHCAVGNCPRSRSGWTQDCRPGAPGRKWAPSSSSSFLDRR